MPVELGVDDDEDTVRRRRRLVDRVVPPTIKLTWSGSSSIGLRRADNQDAWGEYQGRRFVVADGVGSLAGGALASSLAVTAFLAADPNADWKESVHDIDELVHSECLARGQAGAATTLVGIDIEGTTATVIHAGDSRAYLLRDDVLLALTEDHNLANLRRSEGSDPKLGDGRGKPRSLTSYLGSANDELAVGVLRFTLKPADRLLLSSDGVHEQLLADRLAEILGSLPLREVAARLVGASDAAGGNDNATALVVEVAGA